MPAILVSTELRFTEVPSTDDGTPSDWSITFKGIDVGIFHRDPGTRRWEYMPNMDCINIFNVDTLRETFECYMGFNI